eukprot:TRINITY_DN55135_c0_g1_i1.p1 TRINITY_DN55135_c0_g1~~TRINITY_DN55135_c0_g1_i1.p1  ORF type:complete len:332 (+),score=97.96 TRINITY_DN55135_c0_g1_i1:91-996(+)
MGRRKGAPKPSSETCWRYTNNGCRFGDNCKFVHQKRYDRPGPGGLWDFPPASDEPAAPAPAALSPEFDFDIYGDIHSDGHGGAKGEELMRGEPESEPEKNRLHRLGVPRKYQHQRDKLLLRAEGAEEHASALQEQLKKVNATNDHLRCAVNEARERNKELQRAFALQLGEVEDKVRQAQSQASAMRRENDQLRSTITTHRAYHRQERQEHKKQLERAQREVRRQEGRMRELTDARGAPLMLSHTETSQPRSDFKPPLLLSCSSVQQPAALVPTGPREAAGTALVGRGAATQQDKEFSASHT